MAHTEDFWHVRDFRNVEIQSHILKKSELPAQNAERTLYLRKQKKAVNTMDVSEIRNVTLWSGRNHQQQNVKNAVLLCWKKETNWFALMKNAEM